LPIFEPVPRQTQVFDNENVLAAMIRTAACLMVVLMLMPAARAGDIDKVIAVVNDNVITASEFEHRFSRIKAEMTARGGEAPPEQALKQQVLDRMILEEIQLQRAERAGIRVSKSELDETMRGIAQRNNLSLDELRMAMQREGIDYGLLRDNIRSQMLAQRLAERQVARSVVVTDEEVDAFLSQPRAKQASARQRTRYNLSHILLNVSPSDDEARINSLRKKAQSIVDRIRDGMGFEQAAISYSQAEDALDGGKLGWRAPSQLPELFLNALNRIDPGEVTDVIRSPNGFHIIKLNDVEGEANNQVTQFKVRHILIRTDEFTSAQEAALRLEQIRERIVNGEDFGELALAHSDDTVSSVQGGELGWLSPGDTVRPFELVVESLDVDEVSRPVQTPYGVHLIQLMDTRSAQPTEMERANARRQLRAIKTEEKLREWRDQLRDEAYVEIVNPV